MSTSIPSSSAHQAPAESHVPCHQTERQARSSPLPPADWVNQPNTTVTGSAQSHFEFFYQVIFTFVHSALTLLLAPVLKQSQPSSTRSSRRSQQQHRTQRREIQSFREVDPELAMPTTQHHTMTSDNTSTTRMTPVSSSSSILKSQRRRLPSGGEQPQYPAGAMTASHQAASAAAAKSVRFPEPKRSRPPLGRISSSIGSSSTSVSESSSSSSSSSSAASSSSRNGRGRIVAPRYSPRTHHTTYFMSD